MLRSFAIRTRVLLLVGIMILFAAALTLVFLRAVQLAKTAGVTEVETIMLADHKARLHAATHSMALAVGKAIEGLPDQTAKVEAIRAMIGSIRFDEDQSGYYYVYQGTTNVAHPIKPELQGQDLKDLKDGNGVYSIRDLAKAAKAGGGYVDFIWPKPGKGDQPKLGYAEMVPGSDFWIGTGVYIDNVDIGKERAQAAIEETTGALTRNVAIGAALLFLCLVLPLCLRIVHSVTGPLLQTTAAAEELAGGNLNVRLEASGQDELGALQRAFNAMAAKLQAGLEAVREKERQALDMAEQSKELAAGAEKSRAETESACLRLVGAAKRLEDVILVISMAADRVGADSTKLSDGAETQKRRISETATAVEQMNASVVEVARTAGRTAEEARASSEQASQGARLAQDSVQAMRRLQERTEGLKQDMARLDDQANSIGRIMEVISDIADQTNLLALNAAIEAARAGDAGRGFAVVADEVRKLAEKTMTATKDVGQSVAAIQAEARRNAQTVDEAVTAIDGAADLAGRSGSMLTEILAQVERAAAQAQSIAAATEQQSGASEEITRSIEEINAVAQNTADSAAGATQAMASIAKQAAALRQLMEELKGEAARARSASA